MVYKRQLRCLISVFLILASFFGGSVSIAKDAGDSASKQVVLQAWLGDQEANNQVFAVNQQVVLTIDVATPRWFTRGTKISDIEIANTIVKQRNPMATNYTERIDGQTWSRQRWEVTLYPQVSGSYKIDPVAIQVQYSMPDNKSKSATLYTKPLFFNVKMPSGLITDDHTWLSASAVNLSQDWDMSSNTLKVGDVITRTIAVDAVDTLSILIPELLPTTANKAYQTYTSPIRLHDSHERGHYQSSRVEQHTYVLQQGGELDFPSYTVLWWNSDAQQLETIIIEGHSVTVGHTIKSFLLSYWLELTVFLVVVGISILVSFYLQRYFQRHGYPESVRLALALRQKRWSLARLVIYRQLRRQKGVVELSRFNQERNWVTQSEQIQKGSNSRTLHWLVWRGVSQTISSKTLRLPRALKWLKDKSSASK
ncbi:BatD family protein [Agarivorans sp. TSD2052]|uniref:BatD family protein n=1 Tax=Agarivorans sp. TSD2052 TaxID=2937286 RepID=UPI00200EAE4A|nr:BatD family protein [Agarivorans sp. TSD2052]UPW16720.1 BatD family protein [Agarivorans sp. TSD2052]